MQVYKAMEALWRRTRQCLSIELRQIERHPTPQRHQTNRSAQRAMMGGMYYLTHNYGADIARRGPW
jgi:hypothetical protein